MGGRLFWVDRPRPAKEQAQLNRRQTKEMLTRKKKMKSLRINRRSKILDGLKDIPVKHASKERV